MKIRTINLDEHFNGVASCTGKEKKLVPENGIVRKFKQDKGENIAFSLKTCHEGFKIETNYFIGVDWIVENDIAIKVDAKLNKKDFEVDYLSMLQYSMSKCGNIEELKHLIHIDFNKPQIPIDQKNDKLSFFLIIEFLAVLKKIANKGLIKAYYQKTENLSSKIKGKPLCIPNLLLNHTKGDFLHNYCRYNEYGIDCDENRFLKYVLKIISHIIDNEYPATDLRDKLKKEIRYIRPFFSNVSDIKEVRKMKHFKQNALYKEYSQAIHISNLILKKQSYNYSESHSICRTTPPFWIDMSRLFELYVYNKLRENIGEENIIYHKVYTHKQEPDYLIKSASDRRAYIVDAKYKPRYEYSNTGIIDDIRQVSGYSRIIKIYEDLGIENRSSNIPCIIIHPSFEATETLYLQNEESIKLNSKEIAGFSGFLKVGVNLPKIKALP